MRLRLALLALLLLAGCGGSAGRRQAAAPAATFEPLVYMSRNWEYAVPEDVAV
jgi:outer membrane biogenesis lipoprotein LolB